MPIALLVTVSPRLPGLLAPAGWRAVTTAPLVLALPGAAATAAALRADGEPVTDVAGPAEAAAAAAPVPDTVLLATPEEAAGWTVVPRVAGAPEPPGARLLDVVSVMDRLRSPGGCPWDAEQTHASLRAYLLEEAHEAYDAIVDEDPVAMREELGDVLLQVAFHARVAAEAEPGFDVDDVAGDLVDKLVRRHPHVFGDRVPGWAPLDVAAVERGWDEIKQTEKQRRSPTEGVSRSQPATSWGAALAGRAERAGLPTPPAGELAARDAEELGTLLLGLVVAARRRGWDAEDALRGAVRRYADELDAAAAVQSGHPGG
ncbi:MazG family protein [Modestobacter roseus]|uniref:XTP/dITP diphosphohydrolase n=1 Tax=Modestobacter roseus TaxID=1181884 RepID=A0A562IKS9_9ACTN|nr:MazG family protein [Modestobacter roseus]MQA32816.1 nucleotide pyrophosphohydrolase [Modestobacter roseus]TWH71550.1 XTP/dITP diphosphohydrolase [Modestobacter roseus]